MVHGDFGIYSDAMNVPEAMPMSAEGRAGFGNTTVDVFCFSIWRQNAAG